MYTNDLNYRSGGNSESDARVCRRVGLWVDCSVRWETGKSLALRCCTPCAMPHTVVSATAGVIPALRNHLPEIAVVTGVHMPSACVLRCAVALPQLGLQRDLRDARQRLRDRAVTLHRVRDLLELRLIYAGHRGLHRQCDPIDHETFALFGKAHAGLRVDIATGQPRLVAGERKRHRETRGVRRAQDFLGVGAAAVVLEAAREAVRIVLQRAGLGADLS